MTVVGLITLICGAGYAVLGSRLIIAGAGWLVHPDPSPWHWLGLLALLAIPLGIFFVMFAIPVLLAGIGVLWRKQWGRISTIIVAVLAILLGLLWLSGDQDVLRDVTDLTFGVLQIMYGILALVILSVKRAEFSGPRTSAN